MNVTKGVIMPNMGATVISKSSFLNSICQDRIDELGKGLLKKNDYKEITKSIRKISGFLKTTLSKEQLQLVYQLDEEQGRMLTLYENFYYQVGLIDGCTFTDVVVQQKNTIEYMVPDISTKEVSL